MATISLDNEITNYLPLLRNDEKLSLISQIKSFLSIKDPTKKMTREEFIIQYNKELDEAEARMDAGEFISHEDLLKEMESW